MTFEIRAGTPADHRAQSDTVATALLFPPRDDEGWASGAPPRRWLTSYPLRSRTSMQ